MDTMPEVILNGPEGRIEARYRHGTSDDSPIVLVLHPHPQHGGTMNNKVVYTLFQTFSEQGFSCLRFNFRGVGKSQGTFARGEGELADAANCLDWLQKQNENARSVWIAGFSFGSWIALQLLMRRPEISRFVCVAPPANTYDFSFLAPCPASGMIAQGNIDDIVPINDVNELAKKLNKQKGIDVDYKVFDGANHFFANKMDILKQSVQDYVHLHKDEKIRHIL